MSDSATPAVVNDGVWMAGIHHDPRPGAPGPLFLNPWETTVVATDFMRRYDEAREDAIRFDVVDTPSVTRALRDMKCLAEELAFGDAVDLGGRS